MLFRAFCKVENNDAIINSDPSTWVLGTQSTREHGTCRRSVNVYRPLGWTGESTYALLCRGVRPVTKAVYYTGCHDKLPAVGLGPHVSHIAVSHVTTANSSLYAMQERTCSFYGKQFITVLHFWFSIGIDHFKDCIL